LKVWDPAGCTAECTLQVQVKATDDFYAPNVFYPGAAGENAAFRLYFENPGAVNTIRRLSIFDRWGNLIFLGQNLLPQGDATHWNGTAQGRPAAADVYVWKAEINYLYHPHHAFASHFRADWKAPFGTTPAASKACQSSSKTTL